MYWLECAASKRDSVFSSSQIPHRKSDPLRKKSSCLKQFVAPALQVNRVGAASTGVASLYIHISLKHILSGFAGSAKSTISILNHTHTFNHTKYISNQWFWELLSVKYNLNNVRFSKVLPIFSYCSTYPSSTVVFHRTPHFAIFISNALETGCNLVGRLPFYSLIRWKICHRLIKLCLQLVDGSCCLGLRVWAVKWQWAEMASNLHATAADLFHFSPMPHPLPAKWKARSVGQQMLTDKRKASWPMNSAFYGNFLVILQFPRSEMGIEFDEKLLDMHEP